MIVVRNEGRLGSGPLEVTIDGRVARGRASRWWTTVSGTPCWCGPGLLLKQALLFGSEQGDDVRPELSLEGLRFNIGQLPRGGICLVG